MLVVGIIVLVLLLVALLRFGVILEYSDVGFEMWVRVGPFKWAMRSGSSSDSSFVETCISLYRRMLLRRSRKKQREKRPGQLPPFMDILKTVRNMLSLLRRRLLVKKLVLYYTHASNNPVNTALSFVAADAVFRTISPILERNFRIKHQDLRTGVDFTTESARIYAKMHISMAVWEAFYVLFALLPMLFKMLIPRREASKTARRVANQSTAE